MNALFSKCLRVLLLPASLIVFQSVLGAAAGTDAPAYTLFMGADISLEQGKAFHRVEDVSGSNFKIRVDGKDVFIPTQQGTARMRIENSLKLAGTPIDVEKLSVERSYTPARDPRRRFDSMASAGNAASAAADLATGSVATANAGLGFAVIAAQDPHAPSGLVEAATANRDSAVQTQLQAFGSMGSDFNSAGSRAAELQTELGKENYDAIQISMSVSSPAPLADPYVLVIARIHERDAKPGVVRNWIFAQKIDPIEGKSRKIYINQGGLPVGFELEDCQVRLFDQGREVPSNLSPKRVDLTRDQAQQYILIEHLAANKGATLPAAPVFARPPADLKERIASGGFAQAYYVKVDAEGNATGTFADKGCTNTVDDPWVQSIVSNTLFTPALEKGQPVGGVARVQLDALLN